MFLQCHLFIQHILVEYLLMPGPLPVIGETAVTDLVSSWVVGAVFLPLEKTPGGNGRTVWAVADISNNNRK